MRASLMLNPSQIILLKPIIRYTNEKMVSKLNASVESTTLVRIQVPTSLVLLAVVLGVVTAVLFLKDVRSAVSGPVAGDWNSLMNSYRTASAYSCKYNPMVQE